MPERRIDRRVEVGSVRLRVADLDSMLTFYRDTLGFEITHRLGQTLAILSADGFHAHILLTADTERSGPVPSRFSIRYPDRAALADAYRWISRSSPVIDARDEGIRESLYLRIPAAIRSSSIASGRGTSGRKVRTGRRGSRRGRSIWSHFERLRWMRMDRRPSRHPHLLRRCRSGREHG